MREPAESIGAAPVSAIIPTLNRPEYLRQAVTSLLLQTRPAREIIIVDDASDMRFVDEIEALQDLCSSVMVFRLDVRRGSSHARNLGLEKASGECILFLDDDDLLHPEMIESNMSLFSENKDVDVVTNRTAFFHDSMMGKAQCWETSTLAGLGDADARQMFGFLDPGRIEVEPLSHILLQGIQMNASLTRRTSIGDIRFREELSGGGEDWFFWLQMAAARRIFRFNDRILSFVRHHDSNATRKPEYDIQLIRCLETILAGDMVRARYDRFICHVRLFKRHLIAKNATCLRHLAVVLAMPDLLVRHFLSFWLPRMREKRL